MEPNFSEAASSRVREFASPQLAGLSLIRKGMVDRVLVSAHAQGLDAALVLNKADRVSVEWVSNSWVLSVQSSGQVDLLDGAERRKVLAIHCPISSLCHCHNGKLWGVSGGAAPVRLRADWLSGGLRECSERRRLGGPQAAPGTPCAAQTAFRTGSKSLEQTHFKQTVNHKHAPGHRGESVCIRLGRHQHPPGQQRGGQVTSAERAG